MSDKLRPWHVHAALDVAFAAFYAYVAFVLAPSKRAAFPIAVGAVVVLLLAAAVALVVGGRRARLVALVAQGTLLVFCGVVLALLVASAAYLRAVYGALGEGMTWIAFAAAALVLEACGLLPLFQIRMLFREDTKVHFSR